MQTFDPYSYEEMMRRINYVPAWRTPATTKSTAYVITMISDPQYNKRVGQFVTAIQSDGGFLYTTDFSGAEIFVTSSDATSAIASRATRDYGAPRTFALIPVTVTTTPATTTPEKTETRPRTSKVGSLLYRFKDGVIEHGSEIDGIEWYKSSWNQPFTPQDMAWCGYSLTELAKFIDLIKNPTETVVITPASTTPGTTTVTRIG